MKGTILIVLMTAVTSMLGMEDRPSFAHAGPALIIGSTTTADDIRAVVEQALRLAQARSTEGAHIQRVQPTGDDQQVPVYKDDSEQPVAKRRRADPR